MQSTQVSIKYIIIIISSSIFIFTPFFFNLLCFLCGHALFQFQYFTCLTFYTFHFLVECD